MRAVALLLSLLAACTSTWRGANRNPTGCQAHSDNVPEWMVERCNLLADDLRIRLVVQKVMPQPCGGARACTFRAPSLMYDLVFDARYANDPANGLLEHELRHARLWKRYGNPDRCHTRYGWEQRNTCEE